MRTNKFQNLHLNEKTRNKAKNNSKYKKNIYMSIIMILTTLSETKCVFTTTHKHNIYISIYTHIYKFNILFHSHLTLVC